MTISKDSDKVFIIYEAKGRSLMGSLLVWVLGSPIVPSKLMISVKWDLDLENGK